MLNVKNTIVEHLLSLVAPHLCCSCGRTGACICDNCKNNIIKDAYVGCVLCGKSTENGICIDHKVGFNQAYAVGLRSDSLQRLIGNFKFRNMKAASVDIADLLHRVLPDFPQNTVLVPVPTSPAHIRERGYDHMLLIAQHLAKVRHVAVERVLVKTNTVTQHHLSRKDRLVQAQSAFQLNGTIDKKVTYVIVDDVLTTGATIRSAALLLERSGAAHVWVAVTSRQPLD